MTRGQYEEATKICSEISKLNKYVKTIEGWIERNYDIEALYYINTSFPIPYCTLAKLIQPYVDEVKNKIVKLEQELEKI